MLHGEISIQKRSRGRPRKSLNDVFIEDAEQRLDNIDTLI